MKLARFSTNGSSCLGLVVDNSVIDLSRHLPDAPESMTDLMAQWKRYRPGVAALAGQKPDFMLSETRLEAPVQRPGKIFALGLNYADHCAEGGLPVPQHQTWFTKASTSINSPFGELELPVVSTQLDYEAELVIVIGTRARNVPVERTHEVIFGYCVGNDVSVRDWQLLTPQWSLGKSFDKAAPIGPWITTIDSVNPHQLGIRSFVNGEPRQSSNTKHFVFNTFDMVSYLSKAMTLEPGDLIFTGTPSGVGLHWKGGPTFLKVDDVVRVEIDQLGHIENRVTSGSSEVLIG